jgi:hypothetical protein
MSLGDWTHVHADSSGATVQTLLSSTAELEGVTSLQLAVAPSGPAALGPVDLMGYTAGVPQNTQLVRSLGEFQQQMFGVFACIQGSLNVTSQCYAATYDILGNISLWRATPVDILNNSVSPLQTYPGVVPNPDDTYGLELLLQFAGAANQMQLTVSTTDAALVIPVTEAAGEFPDVTVRFVYVDATPIFDGVTSGLISTQLGSYANGANLAKFDITQIYV